jgi:alpha-galactosidase
MQRVINEIRELRPYFMEDFYPLTGLQDHTPDTVWLAYQLDRPSDNTGIVMAFRRSENQQTEIDVRLRGLQTNATYKVTNVDSGEVVSRTGAELMKSLVLRLEKPCSSLLLKYSKE